MTWSQNNPEKARASCKRWRAKNKEKRREYNCMWRKNNPDKHKSQLLRHKFGITYEEYIEILNQQKNKCAICETQQVDVKKRFAVDHDHTTKHIRGLLCSDCNILLGMSKDNVEILLNALLYLKRKV